MVPGRDVSSEKAGYTGHGKSDQYSDGLPQFAIAANELLSTSLDAAPASNFAKDERGTFPPKCGGASASTDSRNRQRATSGSRSRKEFAPAPWASAAAAKDTSDGIFTMQDLTKVFGGNDLLFLPQSFMDFSNLKDWTQSNLGIYPPQPPVEEGSPSSSNRVRRCLFPVERVGMDACKHLVI